jgi:hypothetical protein
VLVMKRIVDFLCCSSPFDGIDAEHPALPELAVLFDAFATSGELGNH